MKYPPRAMLRATLVLIDNCENLNQIPNALNIMFHALPPNVLTFVQATIAQCAVWTVT